MKKLFTLLLTLLSTGGYLLAQTSGGPDTYGYTWKNSNDPTGPTYSWIDITNATKYPTTTMVTGLADDNSVGMFPLGFTMKYYWVDVNSIKIGSNGWIAFSNSVNNIAHGFPNIPQVDGNSNFIAPFLTDLTLTSAAGFNNPGRVYYYTNNLDTAIVSYVNVPFWQNASPEFIGSNTFQVILTKVDNGIKFQYGTMNPVIPNLTTFNDAVVGIENITQGIGIEVMKDVMPPNNTAYKFTRPAASTFQVLDLKANWSNNPKNGAFPMLKGQPLTVTTNIENVGNQNFNGSATARTFVKRNGSNVYNQVLPFTKLRQATDTTLTYATTFTPTLEGTYVINPLISAGGDANTLNNQNNTEFIVVDTTGKKREVSLQYHDGVAEGSTSFGAAVYFTFPFYPTEIRSIDAMFLGPAGVTNPDNTFTIRIYGESPTGGLGAILFDSTLNSTDITLGALNSIEIPQKELYMINSGGVYVAVLPEVPAAVTQNGFLGTDETAPFSLRTFEILSGQLSEFRTASTEDFMIGVNIGTSILSPMSVGKDMNAAITNLYPNPATKTATLEFNLKQAASVEIKLTNIIGSTVKTMNLGKLAAKDQKVVMNVADLKAGVYICTMKVGDNTITKRLVVSK